MNDEGLAAFPPVPRTVQVAGAQISLTPLRVGQLPTVLHTLKRIEPALRQTPIDWLALLAEHGDALLALVAVAAGRERAWVEQLALDDFGVLARAVWEVNLDFFAQRLAPLLNAPATTAPTGPSPSPSSSAPATPSAT
ncbi:MAG: hypothetical protein KGI52_07075 [Burkholderiales bacterium]|nr:hypothetical protein [Burkholderiales bacterium]